VSALGMKYPTFVKPSKDEPLTIQRLTGAMYESDMPDDTLYFMPGNRDFGDELIGNTDKGIVFGGEEMEEKYEGKEDVKTFGPGNSKIYVDEDYVDEDIALELAESSMMRDGGRGCINISQVVVDSDESEAKRFAEELADEIRDIDVMDPHDEDAVIPADGEGTAESLNEYVNQNLGTAEDVVHNDPDDRLVERDGAKFLKPTVVYTEDGNESPLFTELPFQYSAVAPYSEGALDDTLTLTMLTDDEDKVEEAVLNPSIKKVYSGVPTNDIDLKEPHEGYLSDHLYEKKAFRTGGSGSFFSRIKAWMG
ncbi:MAG: aldehyde dehydrogenase family protein, partial [Candidatus Aenigmatarchaeota archaeon]